MHFPSNNIKINKYYYFIVNISYYILLNIIYSKRAVNLHAKKISILKFIGFYRYYLLKLQMINTPLSGLTVGTTSL